jgi:amino acid permease
LFKTRVVPSSPISPSLSTLSKYYLPLLEAATATMDTLSQRKKSADDPPGDAGADHKGPEAAMSGELISAGSQHLHRRLGGKEIQLFAVGGAIGTCMFTSHVKYESDANARWFV